MIMVLPSSSTSRRRICIIDALLDIARLLSGVQLKIKRILGQYHSAIKSLEFPP